MPTVLLDLDSGNLPDPVKYAYYKCLENRQILINEEINDCFLESYIMPFIEMDNDGSGKPIEIILNT